MNAFRLAHSLLAVSLMLSLAACTHSMQVKNLDEYALFSTAPRPLTIELHNEIADVKGTEYFQFVHQALATHPSVARVVIGSQQDVPVDAVVRLSQKPTYKGSGLNYLIAFPGFLLFTHAWNGFNYEADLSTRLEIAMAANGQSLSRDLETKYKLRHCDFGRGAATSSGWYLPGWGLTNLVVGAFMVPYDKDATPAFINTAGPAYGSYVANSIVEAVTQSMAAIPQSPHASACARFDPELGRFVETCGSRT